MRITTIELPVYDTDLVLIIEQDWIQANKKFKLELEEDEINAHAITCYYPSRYNGKHEIYLLLRPDHLDPKTVVHELLHVVDGICDLKGIKLDVDNDEAQAYLIGYIAEHVFKAKDKLIETKQ